MILGIDIDRYSAVRDYLRSFGKRLHQVGKKGTRKKTSNQWFETQDPVVYHKDFEKKKIIYSEIVQNPQFYLDKKNYYPDRTASVLLGEHLEYLLAILNSKPVSYFYKKFYAPNLGSKGYRYLNATFEKLPIVHPDEMNKTNKKKIVLLENLAIEIQNLYKKHQLTKSKTRRKKYKQMINSKESQINNIVYELYNLTKEEIKFVEKK